MSSPNSKLFVLTHEFYPKRGGIATFTEEMARAAASQGWDVEVWAQRLGEAPEKNWPFRLVRLPLRGSHDLSCILRSGIQLFRRRHELGGAVLHLSEPGPMLAMMWMQGIRWLRPRELVLTFYGSEIQRFHRNPIIRMMVRRLIRQSNRVGVITAYTRGLLESHFPESRDKIVMTPCALPTGFTAPAERAPPSPDQVILLTVSRLHPRKGHLITLDALRALPESLRHKIAYWVVGTGKPAYERQLEEAAGTCDFPIKFWGGLTDRELQQVYRDASIFVMTSVAHGPSVEGFGLVYLEASSHGVPVVAHDVGGVSEAVADGYSGVLVPANDPATLTEQLTRLIEDPELRHQLGSNGRKWAQEAQWSTGARALYGTPNG